MKCAYIFLICTLLTACQQKPNSNTKSPSDSSSLKTTQTPYKLTNIVTHAFSDQQKQDTFKLFLSGPTILNSKISFKIISFNNKQIFTDGFNGKDLLGDFEGSEQQQKDTINARFKRFFHQSAFKTPAINKTDKIDKDYIIQSAFDAIKDDATSIGFTYYKGYEGVYSIAYAKKKKETVLYFAFD